MHVVEYQEEEDEAEMAMVLLRPYLERVWEWDSHSRNGDLGVLRDSRKFRVRLQGQKSSHGSVLYIIGNLLKFRYSKWVRMTHLDICNTSYGQKKGRESNWQFDSRPWEVGNRLDSLACRWRVTPRWKDFDEGHNFGLNLVPIGGLH
jgi:hypothetical protein